MDYLEKLKNGIPTVSFEFFPPKNTMGWMTLYKTLSELSHEKPDYVSVTYGAGGSTREKTVELVGRIQGELDISSVAHLTCVGHSKTDIDSILASLKVKGIKTILALRGDPPKGQGEFVPHPDGFASAAELIAHIKKTSDFNVACAYYPEKHPTAASLENDVDFLKIKQDSGADFAISQLFFDNQKYLHFRDLARKRGIQIPLLAGIMPVSSADQLDRFISMAGTYIPDSLRQKVMASTDPVDVGVEYGTQQCMDLLREGVPGIHLYTLNKTLSSRKIVQGVRALGALPFR